MYRIAEALDMTRASATGIVDRMAQRGLSDDGAGVFVRGVRAMRAARARLAGSERGATP